MRVFRDIQMRVLFVTPSYFPITGGSEVLTRVLAQKVKEAGVQSDIMTLNMNIKWFPRCRDEVTFERSTKVFKQGGVNPLPRLPNPFSQILRINIIPRLSYIKKLNCYDILHFVGEDDLSFAFLSKFVKKPRLMQCVAVHKNGGLYRYYIREKPCWGKLFAKAFPTIADKFLVSSLEEKKLLRDLGVSKEKIAIIKIGVDVETFKPDPEKKTEDVILFVGRIYKVKGLHILLQALQYIDIPVKLVVIGPSWDSEYMREIDQQIKSINRIGLHRITLLGELDSSALVPWYQRAAIVVCPFVYEPSSNVVREALACGTPVISTGTHIVEKCPDGIRTTKKDPKSLADAITFLLKEHSARRRMGNEGRGVIETHYSWESIIEDLLKLYQDASTSFLSR
jgi:glycosyltransferase involved in cell wall biosynthesis